MTTIFPVRVLLANYDIRYSESFSGLVANPTCPPTQLTAFISSPPVKVKRKNDFRSPTPNWPFSNSAASSATVIFLVAFGQFFPLRTRFFLLAAQQQVPLWNVNKATFFLCK